MKQEIIFVGLDVDDKAFHIGIVNSGTGEIHELVSRPTASSFHQKMKAWRGPKYKVKVCYEASYIGFTLQRALMGLGWECEVISPNQIPREFGAKVKTDRLDALKLANYYSKGLLTAIYTPSEQQEAERDLLRGRRFIREQQSNLKRYILSLCRRAGIEYRKDIDDPGAHYWTAKHHQWLRGAIGKATQSTWVTMLSTLLVSLRHTEEQIEFLDMEIEKISQTSRYKKANEALSCFRGLSTLSSMTLLTELGTVKRFAHPRQMTSFAGMDIREYSSGGKERKSGITKMGNVHLRRALVESCQSSWQRPAISGQLKRRRAVARDPSMIAIADRCMKRLHSRAHHLMQRGKHKNKVKVACARELLGFVWESLRAANY
jgi:transposase